MKAMLVVLFNIINFLLFYVLAWCILDTEFDWFSSYNKWSIYAIGVILFVAWVFLYSYKVVRLNKRIYIITFVMSLTILTLFSGKIIDCQDSINFAKAENLIDKINKGSKINETYYWIGLSTEKFLFQKKEADSVLIFMTKKGYFHVYDFKLKKWYLADISLDLYDGE